MNEEVINIEKWQEETQPYSQDIATRILKGSREIRKEEKKYKTDIFCCWCNKNIDEDVYYNVKSKDFKTEGSACP